MTYQLSIQAIQDTCLFELLWGRGQRLRASVAYPTSLNTRYQQWQRAYVNFYKRALRGRVGAVGQVASVGPDLHSQLVQAEARLLSEFHRWLRQGELADIRKTLSIAARDQTIDLFLTCTPLEIARLPWETWEIGAEFGGAHIRMARSPSQIRVAPPPLSPQRRRPRVLVILGDDTGLDVAGDRRALQALKSLVDITVVGWTPGQDAVALKQDICQAIAAPQGWDILFFAGHSNEADAVAGHIYVAPQTALAIRELHPYLQTAQAQGLQFALFNSCSGLTIADALIELGISQVAVMREPIHNQVAQQFLIQFLHSLARHRDVQDALHDACRYLKSEQHLTYPSAYLVPSLFRQPDSIPFRIAPRGWQQVLRAWQPGRKQAIALATVVLLSVIPGVRESLLSGRLLMQAVYRSVTQQLPTTPPEVVLVQIDEASRQASPDLLNISPINLDYLADVVDVLMEHDAQVIGVDYLLDLARSEEQTTQLAATVRNAVANHQAWFVFSAILRGGQEVGVNPASAIMDPNWAMEAYTNAPRWYMTMPWATDACRQTCPFAYLLAATARHHQTLANPLPDLTRQTPLRPELITAIATSADPQLRSLARQQLGLLTQVSTRLRQQWLRPILDFSLPPDRILHRVSAHELLEGPVDAETIAAIANASVTVIGRVEYTEGDVDPLHSDLAPNPPAIALWRSLGQDTTRASTFAGAEAITYTIHHHLQSHRVTPVPDLWMVGIGILVAPAITFYGIARAKTPRQGLLWLTAGTAGYGWLSGQAMISAGLLLPWLLPSAVVWMYALPTIWRLKQS